MDISFSERHTEGISDAHAIDMLVNETGGEAWNGCYKLYNRGDDHKELNACTGGWAHFYSFLNTYYCSCDDSPISYAGQAFADVNMSKSTDHSYICNKIKTDGVLQYAYNACKDMAKSAIYDDSLGINIFPCIIMQKEVLTPMPVIHLKIL